MKNGEIVIYKSEDGNIKVDIMMKQMILPDTTT